MALTSPGVEVTVIDESFYTPAAPGTTPLIVFATAENKTNAAGTGTAAGTLAANIGRAFRITSQRELVETYGLPFFEQAVGGAPIHGGERNEYGLLSAYSMLGITNSIFTVRANIDLNALQGSTVAPGAEPKNGAWWFDTRATAWGIQEWNSAPRNTAGGQQFSNKTPIVLTDADVSRIDVDNNAPLASVGSIGDYAVVARTVGGSSTVGGAAGGAAGGGGVGGGGGGGITYSGGSVAGNFTVAGSFTGGVGAGGLARENIRMYYKSPGNSQAGIAAGTWVLVGDQDWQNSIPAVIGSTSVTQGVDVDQLAINNTTIVSGNYTADQLASVINGLEIPGITVRQVNGVLYVYTDGTSTAGNAGSVSQTFTVVSVPNPDGAGAIYQVDGVNKPVLNLVRGGVYTFDQSDASNVTHQIAFKDGAGDSYTVGVVTTGDVGEAGAQTVITVAADAPDDLRYYCVTHGNNMGNVINVTGGGFANGQIEFEGADWTKFGISADTYFGPALQHSPHTQVPTWRTSEENRPTGSVWLKTTEPNAGSRWRVKRYSAALQTFAEFSAPLFTNNHAALYFLDRTGGGANLPVDTLYVQYNATEDSGFDTTPATVQFRIWHRAATEETVIRSAVVSTGTFSAITYTFSISESRPGQLALEAAKEVSFIANGTALDAQTIAAAINAAGFFQIEADVTDENEVLIYHKSGGDFRLSNGTDNPLNLLFSAFNIDLGAGTVNLYAAAAGSGDTFLASNWMPLAVRDFAASANQPLAEPADGQLWYNPNFGEVDIMIHDGSTWRGYKNVLTATDPNGPQVSASAPTTKSDGSSALSDGDLWIGTADLENFPNIYRWDGLDLEWYLLDKTDQTTEDGVLFADARYGDAGKNVATAIRTLLTSDFLDPDAPDPDLFPRGMILWNTRRSGGNVKRYADNYIDVNADNPRQGNATMTDYDTDRWITASPNNEDGSGAFGRKAQRSVVVQALKSVVDTSEEARDEERRNFNLIACPGYPELLSNLVNLNIDRGVTAFVVGDTPLRLRSDATSLTTWATNANGAFDNGDDGLVTFDEFAAVYYPNGFTTDLGGANVVVPASHMMLRTIALSDQVSFPWFAPAGTRRGGITNATSVGFIDAATGEFRTVALNNGQRDTLYDLKVNPIPFFVGVGHVAYGQKTLARNASALDRINVARLVVYLRSQLNRLARPFIFEPNDKITRDEIKGAVESLLLELVGLRALNDFAVVCDESNNTPSRIDRNELYVDIAIEPVKAVEFIYIPLRIQNTGAI